MASDVTSVSNLQISISGSDPSQRLQKVLRERQVIRIGRAPQQGWSIPWDLAISREHADIIWNGTKLRVTMTPDARNPIVYRGQRTKKLYIAAGDWFQIGSTTFQASSASGPTDLHADGDTVEFDKEPGSVMAEYSYSQEDLRQVAFRDTDQQLETLSKLPQLISGSHSDEELGGLLSQLLLRAISAAEAVAVAHFDATQLPKDESEINNFPQPLTLRLETRVDFTGRFNPSRRMIQKALQTQASVLHIWDTEQDSGGFTISEGLGWAFCAPIHGESCQGWCMYVSGKGDKGGGTDCLGERFGQ